MNELLLYAIIQAVLDQSTVIAGRFFVAEGYGNDLNTENFNNFVKDSFGSNNPMFKKYPVSILLPPVEILESYEKGWSRFKCEQYFLCKMGYTGDNSFKNFNNQTNASEHPIIYDWKDMRECAGDFRRVFNQSLRQGGYLNHINWASGTPDVFRRVSKVGGDQLAGVYVSYELNIAMPCTTADYPTPLAIDLPAVDSIIHASHLH